MGTRGPIPKRSDQRVRRNKDVVPIEKIPAIGPVEQPELLIEDPHPITERFWKSLGESAQARFYEPSDWGFAQFVFYNIDYHLKSRRLSGQLFAAINSALASLLVTEGDRRRLRLEIEREQAEGAVIDIASRFREMLGQ